MATMRIAKMKASPSRTRPPELPPAPAPTQPSWGSPIWVRVTHPLAQFSQAVRNESGLIVGEERVIAVTDPLSHHQVSVPVQVTMTREVEKALRERPIGARGPVASIIVCTDGEVAAWLADPYGWIADQVAQGAGGGLGQREHHAGRATKARESRFVHGD
jgi:hypothetical protein